MSFLSVSTNCTFGTKAVRYRHALLHQCQGKGINSSRGQSHHQQAESLVPAKRRNVLESCILAEYWVRPSSWEAHTSQLDMKGIGPVLPSQSQVKLEGVWTQKAAGDSENTWASPTPYASTKWGNTKLPSFTESFLLALVKSEMYSLTLEKKNSLFH